MTQTAFDDAYPEIGSRSVATDRAYVPAENVGTLPLLATTPGKSVAALLAPGRRRAFFVDADAIERSAVDMELRGALGRADILLSDGPAQSGRSRFDSRPHGAALMPLLLLQAAAQGKSVFLFGGEAGAAEAAAMGMMMQARGLRIAGTLADRATETAPEAVCERINASGADILLVSMPSPGQEAWLDQYGQGIHATLQMGVGSVFNAYVQSVIRSPRLLSVWRA